MKPIIMFITSWCPYCKKALLWMEELKKENPQYENVEVKIIDEEHESEIAKKYSYYYVPTYYVDGIKVHEGVPTKDIIKDVFERTIK
ncbi:glutaredoxin [Clostridium tetanomorphum]|uniref:Glutaredoxin n=1 Tax=Clostridium tetanomorphum TaxID=1553 RepID=A0A923EA48_CLOTT|nr:thioredoxin family protein [Clostridium tetanomorphum]KAJ53702.1 glutaredoxin-like protein [Clostridium tetanomorphum DSM 665]MBC2397214.1 glutaredoxin [Clostridium tetanomorphum]MBP1862429.1 glutaredoxin [Clostridium tetanomorphum]NRS85731.1 glutaredoxin [Clostridium tetanomorphum]NRZ96260.1 glutaredoxin [Clostridium tetanomorphum]